MIKITKTFLADQLGISRPTLIKYLKSGFPEELIEKIGKIKIEKEDIDYEYEKVLLENEIRLHEYQISKIREQVEKLEAEQRGSE